MNQLNNRVTALLRSHPVIMQLLRFAAIGSLNTALDFIILNYVTKSFDVTSGVALGALNVISFTAAIIQSYFWNKAWAFSESSRVSLFQNFVRLFTVGGLGLAAFLAVFIGAYYDGINTFFLMVLIGFVVVQICLWIAFGLKLGYSSGGSQQFITFLIVSLVGLAINSIIVVIAAHYITPYLEMNFNADTIKNVAKIVATVFSLIWNFIGYKLIVFKR
ncbi:MAG TPA: GtrA family protein [Patescibacteria group bacterium]|jgi:putative flippase GtrA|nr:GtrA family protein [Patescibacteria group bacterium]